MKPRPYLDKRQWDQLDPSIRFAAEIGRPINTFITLQYGATALEPVQVGPATRKLLKNYITPWLRPTRTHPIDHRPAVWFYFLEDVATAVYPHGAHAHIGMHVPPGRRADLEAKLTHWLEQVAGVVFDTATAVDVRDTDKNGIGLKLYAGKALKPADARKRKVRPSSQGIILGRRLSISQSIHAGAIAAHREQLRVARLTLVRTSAEPIPANDLVEFAKTAGKGPPWSD